MADAYPAFGFKYNNNPGTGSGPMGGPGPFAPGNTPVYGRRDTPVNRFLDSIGVAKVDENGQATGTTGGNTFLWSDQRAQYNELLGAEQQAAAQAQARQGNQTQQGGGNMTPPSAAPTNSFLPPAATGGVRVNGLTPATLAPGGTPMLGRDYGTTPEPGAGLGRLGSFAKDISLADGPVARNGALFNYGGAGKGFSITQDPNTVPAKTGGNSFLGFTPEAAAIASQALGAGMDRNTFAQSLAAGKFNEAVPDNVVLTPMQQAARAKELSDRNNQALTAFDRVANQGIAITPGMAPGVVANRQATMQRLLGLEGNAMAAARAEANAKIKTAQDIKAPKVKPLQEGETRDLEVKPGVFIKAQLVGNRWQDMKTGAPIWYTPQVDRFGEPIGAPSINPVILGGQPGAAPTEGWENPGGKAGNKPKLSPEEARAELKRRQAAKKNQG